MNTDGFNSEIFFQDGLITDLIEDESGQTSIELSDTKINFDAPTLCQNDNVMPILLNRIVVRQASDFGVIDSDVEYWVDGVVDMGTTSISVPSTGINITGYNFIISKLISTENNYTLFTNGSNGDFLIRDISIEVSGTNSQVYDIKSATGNEAIEVDKVNYDNCTSLGIIDNYRQGLETGTGRFGGTPNLELVGIWTGGYRITTCIVRDLDVGMTGALFEAGLGFSMASRFLSDINCDLPASAAFIDFASANFPNSSTVQLHGCIMTRNGVIDPTDTNLTPNLPATALAADFVGNLGLPSTLFGGRLTCSTQALSSIAVLGTYITLAGTFTASELVHFDSPGNGELRHLDNQPREYVVFGDLIMSGVADDLISVRILKTLADTSTEVVYTQNRGAIKITGAQPDQVSFNMSANIVVDVNDKIHLEVANLSSTSDVILLLDSYIFLVSR